MKKTLIGLAVYYLIVLYFVICWILNIIQFIQCDFEPSYKEEIIKGIAIFIAPLSGITVWF